MILEIGSN